MDKLPTRKQVQKVIFFCAAMLLLVKIIRDQEKLVVLNHLSGQTMGTIVYNVKYKTKGEQDYQQDIDSILEAFNHSMSTYIPNSEISRFNRNDTIRFENNMFFTVLERSKIVFDATGGAFDPTIGPVINAWGFGPNEKPDEVSNNTIDSLLKFVGFDNIVFNEEAGKKPKGFYLDLSAVAKGYAVDLISEYLIEKNISDYMVEIGGEVRTSGVNDKQKNWAIGIEDPTVEMNEQKLLAIAQLENKAVATSGNYRNYYKMDGEIHAHIIDPRTGYNSRQNILSASVFAPDCMTADAYATAFMVLGVEKSLEIVESDPSLEALFIFRSDTGSDVIMTDGISKMITLVNKEED